MTFTPDDDRLHVPPDPRPERWQENRFFIAWDTADNHGVMIHTRRFPDQRMQEAHVVACVGGRVGSALLVRDLADVSRTDDEFPELDMTVIDPFREWHIGVHLMGFDGVGPMGFVATHPSGPIPVHVDITLASSMSPVDWNEALEVLESGLEASAGSSRSSAQAHYEQAGTFQGTLAVGEDRVETSGLFVRDHTWGPRHEMGFGGGGGGVFWTACSLDEGRTYCNAIAFAQPDGGFVGVGIIADEDGVRTTRDVRGEYLPERGVGTYSRSRIFFGFPEGELVVEGTTCIHLPLYLWNSGQHRYDNNAISSVRLGDKHGMGVLEWASTLDPAQSAVLDRAGGLV